MKRQKCSYCDGTGFTGYRIEAIEAFIGEVFCLEEEPVHPIVCPKCKGSGIEYEIELKDLCEVKA